VRMMGSSPEGSFWHWKSPILAGLARQGQKRETGSIESDGDLMWWIWEVLGWILGF